MANQLPILKIKTIPITEVNVKEKEVLMKVTTSSKEDLLNHKKYIIKSPKEVNKIKILSDNKKFFSLNESSQFYNSPPFSPNKTISQVFNLNLKLNKITHKLTSITNIEKEKESNTSKKVIEFKNIQKRKTNSSNFNNFNFESQSKTINVDKYSYNTVKPVNKFSNNKIVVNTKNGTLVKATLGLNNNNINSNLTIAKDNDTPLIVSKSYSDVKNSNFNTINASKTFYKYKNSNQKYNTIDISNKDNLIISNLSKSDAFTTINSTNSNEKNKMINNKNLNPPQSPTSIILSKNNQELEDYLLNFKNFDFNKFSYLNSLCSKKSYSFVNSFGYNTHNGTMRNYNEDRVSIHLHVKKPVEKKYDGNWPEIHFFCVIDGHGGSKCADFVKDNLIKNIVSSNEFPENISSAIKEGMKNIELEFLEKIAINQSGTGINDFSGACCVFIIIVGKRVFVANLGDSRILMIRNNYKDIDQVTVDHKPDNYEEHKRIVASGGNTFV